MLPTVPLFPGIPGGIELLVVLLILVVPLVLLALTAVGIGLFRRGSSNDAEVERLERRVEELERQRDESDRMRTPTGAGGTTGGTDPPAYDASRFANASSTISPVSLTRSAHSSESGAMPSSRPARMMER